MLMNKKVFGVEGYAIYQALLALDQRQESSYQCAVFVDSTAAINRVETDAIGPGQRFVIATTEVCSRIVGRDTHTLCTP